MKNNKRLLLELLLIAIICVLAVLWTLNPEGDFEPFIVLIGSLVSLVAVVTSLYVRKKNRDSVVEEQLKPSQLHFINQLIELKANVYKSARERWGCGKTSEMREGNDDVMAFYKDTWLRLADNFPVEHFGNVTHVEYLNKFISESYETHYQAADNEGCGEGSMAYIIVTAGVMKDLGSQVAELVFIMSSATDAFDYGKWLQRWKSVA
ncbi:hypothetical protein D6V32_19070 [Vibrio cholerae]|nr:hypothetical protein [Vibrio cholerae]MVC35983.1 hypothetical protein [Vibrio cholerae]